MISVILIEPSKSGNLGAICRVMKNFGFSDLVLINPKCKVDSQTAKNRAKHAQDVLARVKVKDLSYLKRFDTLVATTSKLGTDYNIARSPIDIVQLASVLKGKGGKIGIVFGRESDGLRNNEIQMCDFVVTIPASKKYPTLNLSQAVVVVLYELYKVLGKDKVDSHIVPASGVEKKQVLKLLDKALSKMDFSTAEKKDTQRKVWKRMLGKSFLTKREAFALCGMLRKIK